MQFENSENEKRDSKEEFKSENLSDSDEETKKPIDGRCPNCKQKLDIPDDIPDKF